MYLECILVCVDYADFLAHTLPLNIGQFDRVIVVTAPHDLATQQVCAEHGAVVVLSNRMFEEQAAFNKGKAINDGMKQLAGGGWVLITDADMVMPSDLRSVLEALELEQEAIYGTSRYLCPTYAEWSDYQATSAVPPSWRHESERVCIGVGFFQLFHSQCAILKESTTWYSERWTFAGRSDRLFLRRWHPSCRKRLPGVVPVHLNSSSTAPYKANWYGRVTPRFGEKSYTSEFNLDLEQ